MHAVHHQIHFVLGKVGKNVFMALSLPCGNTSGGNLVRNKAKVVGVSSGICGNR